MVQGAPLLGDGGTDIEAVHAFYDFWGGFKSWREFDVEDDELDVEQATWRGEKRWMEREIEREKKKLKNKENKRIRKLVDRAYANDPRIKSATHPAHRPLHDLFLLGIPQITRGFGWLTMGWWGAQGVEAGGEGEEGAGAQGEGGGQGQSRRRCCRCEAGGGGGSSRRGRRACATPKTPLLLYCMRKSGSNCAALATTTGARCTTGF